MAELGVSPRWSAAQRRGQYGAIAWLRWRILVNSFRRKGGAGELVASILLYPIFAAIAIGPVVGSFFLAYFIVQSQHLARLSWLLWGIFLLCQLFNLQLGIPGTVFDPRELIRFPMTSPTYTRVRLFFGLLTPSNILGALMSLAVAIGITVADSSLALWAFVAMAIFASTIILFSRMVFAWVERWLATRRSREIFTAIIFAVSIGFQWANVSLNPAYNHHGEASARWHIIQHLLNGVKPLLTALPPELSTQSIQAASLHQPVVALLRDGGTALYGLAFLLVFSLRMGREFRGENLSEGAHGVKPQAKRKPAVALAAAPHTPVAATSIPAGATTALPYSELMRTLLSKEWLMMKRNMGVLYSVIAPLIFVLLFAGKLSHNTDSPWIFPAAVAYTLLGSSMLTYNSLGLEGSGAQLYFLAPVRVRDVMLAKNMLFFGLAVLEVVAAYAIVRSAAGVPSLSITAITVLWCAATVLLTAILGNRRSIIAPKKINIARAAGKQVSQLSSLIAMGTLLGSCLLAASLVALELWKGWTLPVLGVFVLLLAAALWGYSFSLRGLDPLALDHREEIFEELSKKM
jgi:ABC-2 type transport system permease protein